jgi:hypothetical protein
MNIEITKKKGRCAICGGLIQAKEKIVVMREELGKAQEFYPNGMWVHTDCWTLTRQSARLPRR